MAQSTTSHCAKCGTAVSPPGESNDWRHILTFYNDENGKRQCDDYACCVSCLSDRMVDDDDRNDAFLFSDDQERILNTLRAVRRNDV